MDIFISIIIVFASMAVIVTGLRYYFRFHPQDHHRWGGLFLVVASIGFSFSVLVSAAPGFRQGMSASISEVIGIAADIFLAIGYVRLFDQELVDERIYQNQLQTSLTASEELLYATRQLNNSLDLPQTLNNFVQRAQVLARSDVAFIFLNEKAFFLDDHVFKAGLIASEKVDEQMLEKMYRKIAESGNLTIWSGQEEFRASNSLLSMILKTIAGFPIKEGNDLLRVLFVGYKKSRRIDPHDLLLMTELADHGALAIRNAGLFQKVKELSVTNPLTNLANRREFEAILKMELASAHRYNDPLSLLILDIDHFKTINDTWGHPAGDAILKMVAGILQNEIRVGDLAAREGGDEFAILLPHTDLPSAFQLGERLRGEIEKAVFQWQEKTIHTTCSIGVVGETEKLSVK